MNSMSNLSVPSSLVQGRATEGLAAMGQARDCGARRAQGDQFLASIASDPTASDMEKLIAATARASTSGNIYSSTATQGQTNALRVMAAGLGGPSGVALATLGAEAMQGAYNSEDARAVSSHWVQALSTSGAPTERLLASAVSESTDLKIYNTSANEARRAAFGMVGAGLQSTPEVTLAQYGLAAMKSAYNSEDSRAMASTVLSHVEKAGSDPEAALLAEVARTATSQRVYNATATATQRRATELITSPPTREADVLLATLGSDSIASAYNSEDARAMGDAFLSAIEAHGQNSTVAIVAGAAHATSALPIYNATAVGVQRAALAQIQGGIGQDTVEIALARLGCASRPSAYNNSDLRALGSTLLAQVASHTTDPQAKSLVDWALQETAGSMRDSEATQIQQDVFDGIIQGRLAIPPPPPPRASSAGSPPGPAKIDPAVTLPVIDPAGDPQEQRAHLEDSITKNRALIQRLEAEATAAGADLPDLLSRISSATKRLQELEGEDLPLRGSYQLSGKLGGTAGVVGMVGLAAALITASPIAIGVAAVGGIAFVAARARVTRAAQELNRRHQEFRELESETLQMSCRAAELQSRVGAAHLVVEQAEKAIRDADRQLDVFRMADAITLPPSADATVSLENETLMIGGLRIPRRMVPLDPDLPTA